MTLSFLSVVAGPLLTGGVVALFYGGRMLGRLWRGEDWREEWWK